MNRKEELQARRARLSAAKQALLAKRLAAVDGRVIHKRPNQKVYPLSFAQERLWFLAQLEPDSPAYNRPLALRLTGSLNLSLLEQALNEIVRRHEVLRATFSTVDGRPLQQIRPAQPIHSSIVDLSELPASEREQKANRLLALSVERPFDLTENVLRTTLLRLEPEEHILLIVIHHIAFDAWSAQLFIKEMSAFYRAKRVGHPSPLPDLPIQVADFAHWERQHLQGERLEKPLSYWKEKLAGIEPLNLPTDHPSPARPTYRAGQQSLILPSKWVESLQALSQQEGVTLFMTLLAAFQSLLYRYTGQDDITVGTPIAARTHIETERLIGCFLNTLVLRTDLSGLPTFPQLLARVRQMTLEAYAHQELPFEKLVEQLQPERELNRSPLFQVMFNLENLRHSAAKSGQGSTNSSECLSINEFEFDWSAAQFDLTLEIVTKDQELSCLFVYNRDLFEAPTIKRMTGHFQTLLEGIVANPSQPISDLPLLTDAERHQLLVEWNECVASRPTVRGTATDYPKQLCIHQLFEAQVARTPDAIAVVFKNQPLTYRETNEPINWRTTSWRKE